MMSQHRMMKNTYVTAVIRYQSSNLLLRQDIEILQKLPSNLTYLHNIQNVCVVQIANNKNIGSIECSKSKMYLLISLDNVTT